MWIDKLKNRWQIQSNVQLVLILIVFSITGSVAAFFGGAVLAGIGINKQDTSKWAFLFYRIAIIVPLYQVLLFLVSIPFGQFRFFLNFQKKTWKRLFALFGF